MPESLIAVAGFSIRRLPASGGANSCAGGGRCARHRGIYKVVCQRLRSTSGQPVVVNRSEMSFVSRSVMLGLAVAFMAMAVMGQEGSGVEGNGLAAGSEDILSR